MATTVDYTPVPNDPERAAPAPAPAMRRSASASHIVTSTFEVSDEFSALRIMPLEEPEVPLHEEVSSADMAATFWDDLKSFHPGSMPHSTVVGVTIGVFCGFVAYVYYFTLEWLFDVLWRDLPNAIIVPYLDPSLHWIWIPALGLTMAICVGLSVRFMGEPGDLSYTVECVHNKGMIGMDHVLPMLAASQFSILGCGSLGPEAPLVAICASFAGYISRKVFRMTKMNLIRKHTLMGMSCALAAFFGDPLGGSLFALEINNRFGIEYYEHTVEAIFAGTVCLCVFRALTRLEIGAIWEIETVELPDSLPITVGLGAALGLVGALIAAVFAQFHKVVMYWFKRWGLMTNDKAVQRALVGSSVVLLLAVLIPHTAFWGEDEFQTIATASPASTLTHIFPTSGLLGFEMTSFGSSMIVGITKMIAVSFTVAAGYRGGFIFPFFAAGAAFGKALCYVIPSLSPTIATLCIAVGINVSITRTALASSLILTNLSGEINAGPPILAAAMVSLFATRYMPFIRSQVRRQDLRRTTPDRQRPSTVNERVDEGQATSLLLKKNSSLPLDYGSNAKEGIVEVSELDGK